MHERPPWLARVRNSGGGTAGTAVAVDGEHVVTCAHLAEPRQGGAALLLEPGREVVLEFPFLGSTATATVVDGGWFPEMPDGTGDFAVLRMADPPPGLAPAPLRRLPGPVGSAVELRGFPDDSALARTAKGRLSNPPRPEWIQIDPDGEGWSVAKGFSGGPVWDVGQQAVIGLTVAKDANRVGHMLAMHYLCELWPPLTEQLAAIPPAAEEDLSHWWPRARGLSGTHEQGWLFRGRRKALTEIVDWLRDGRRHSVLVVTGTPGVGKSATLGRIVTTSHQPWAAMLPEDDTAVRAEPGSVDCAVHANGKTALEVANEILARRGGGPVERPEDFAGAMARALAGGERFNVVLDALDEAADAKEARAIASRVLRPLSELPNTSVVVGGRRVDGSGDLLAHFGNSLHRLDLDSPEYFEFQDLTDYAEAALRQASGEQRRNPYGDPGTAGPVARRIAELAEGNFLVAGLVARSHGRYDEEPVAPEALAFSSDVSVVFWDYLERLEPFDDVPAEELLTALAFADAPGFTAELWSAALRSLEGTEVSPMRLARFAKSGAANFLIETGAADGRSFRIFHQALVDACLGRRARTEEDRAESEALLTKDFIAIGRAEGWEQAPPYLWRSLIGHAARGDAVGALLDELDFLVVADPERMLPMLGRAGSGEAALRASIYRASSGHLAIATLHERRALLAYNAARFGADQLAADLARPAKSPGLEWRPLWATGSGIDSRLQLTIQVAPTGSDAITCAVVDDVPVVAVGVGDAIKVWNLVTGSPQAEVPSTSETWVTALAGGTLNGAPIAVIGHEDGAIRVADLATGRVLSRTEGPGGTSIRCLAWATVDGREVAVSGDDIGSVKFTDLRTGAYYGDRSPSHIGSVNAVACTEIDGRPLAVSGGEDGSIRIWDLTTAQQSGELRLVPPVKFLSVSAIDCAVLDGRPVAVAGDLSGLLQVWDLQTREPLGAPFGDEGQIIRALACRELQGVPAVVTADRGGMIRVWSLRDRREHGEGFRAANTSLGSLACTALGGRQVAITAGIGEMVRVWDLLEHEQQGESTIGHDSEVSSMTTAMAAGASVVLSSSRNDGITLRKAATGATVRRISGKRSIFTLKDIAGAVVDGEWTVAAVQQSDVIRIWQVGTGEQLRPILIEVEWPQAIASVSMEGRAAAVIGGDDGVLRLRDLHTGDPLGSVDTGNEGGISAMDSLTIEGDPHAVLLVYGGELETWNLRTGERRHRLEFGFKGWISNGLACAELDGELFAAVGYNREATVVDLSTGAVKSVIPFPEPVQTVAFTEEGHLAVGSGRDVSVFARTTRRRKHAAS
ncbi:trypsin-like peptidase domain-containing protein [Glycomyces harbinensis]|uniref:WD40 repeat n=1 Tax=Glycomyces harbinensis TaxID=58114 RepID=A0A1G6R5D3_9ACTN|nr:trypsin-like peptidase domain-containing protein [Glycomyces harbinensis]SDC99295.1 WD40 repeat [Glycomyces harbinensis]